MAPVNVCAVSRLGPEHSRQQNGSFGDREGPPIRMEGNHGDHGLTDRPSDLR